MQVYSVFQNSMQYVLVVGGERVTAVSVPCQWTGLGALHSVWPLHESRTLTMREATWIPNEIFKMVWEIGSLFKCLKAFSPTLCFWHRGWEIVFKSTFVALRLVVYSKINICFPAFSLFNARWGLSNVKQEFSNFSFIWAFLTSNMYFKSTWD